MWASSGTAFDASASIRSTVSPRLSTTEAPNSVSRLLSPLGSVARSTAAAAAVERATDPNGLSNLLTEFGASVVESLGDTVDRIEAEASKAVPELAHMDLEAD